MSPKLHTLQEHLILDHEVDPKLVMGQDWRVRLAKHQELHPDADQDEHVGNHVGMRHVHLTGQHEKDCFICSGPRYGSHSVVA